MMMIDLNWCYLTRWPIVNWAIVVLLLLLLMTLLLLLLFFLTTLLILPTIYCWLLLLVVLTRTMTLLTWPRLGIVDYWLLTGLHIDDRVIIDDANLFFDTGLPLLCHWRWRRTAYPTVEGDLVDGSDIYWCHSPSRCWWWCDVLVFVTVYPRTDATFLVTLTPLLMFRPIIDWKFVLIPLPDDLYLDDAMITVTQYSAILPRITLPLPIVVVVVDAGYLICSRYCYYGVEYIVVDAKYNCSLLLLLLMILPDCGHYCIPPVDLTTCWLLIITIYTNIVTVVVVARIVHVVWVITFTVVVQLEQKPCDTLLLLLLTFIVIVDSLLTTILIDDIDDDDWYWLQLTDTAGIVLLLLMLMQIYYCYYSDWYDPWQYCCDPIVNC